MSSAELHHFLGAYLLGGLEPADALKFEQHLAGCADCRRELDVLASLPALLDALPVADALALTGAASPPAAVPDDPAPPAAGSRADGTDNVPVEAASLGAASAGSPAALLDELAVRRRKSRRRWTAIVGAVAAACLALGVLAAPMLNQPPRPDASYSVEAPGGLQVQLALMKKQWGTEVSFSGTSLPTKGTLSLWVLGQDGTEDRACSWSATPGGRSRITGATPTQMSGISRVELRNEGQQTVAVISMVDGTSGAH
ncbi:anti-sigma factor [Arthrobacter sp. ISL-72]|uniref:anti-sigma factor family protein n=1 Tax=Arthrobacter sp. ISL-72 TaxID=2819114 RepID=UPI001BEA9057|nr:zf-HC2 domain-containing protein [Arthrobacter sp. ISL-72]MBT2593908.1 zf-HC2 domain-containing protein [Arthrobacter sp. ISL-72]